MIRIPHLLMLALPLGLMMTTACADPTPVADFETCSNNVDAFDVSAASIDGDTLTVTSGYSGCDTVELFLCWDDQSFMESDPVQVQLELDGADPGDCDAYFEGDDTFDLTPLKTAWQEAYQAQSGTITVHIGGETVTYTF